MRAADAATTLWMVRVSEEEIVCVARLLRHGVQVEIQYNGSMLMSRIFQNGDEALTWAEEKRTYWRTGGPVL